LQALHFRPIGPFDVHALQAMIQDTDYSAVSFNQFAQSILVATYQGYVVGFAYGHKGYAERANILTIEGTYLRTAFDDDIHTQEL
jgi:hypothetical protein